MCFFEGEWTLQGKDNDNSSSYPIRGKGQSHALKLASWLAKGEVMLFGFGNYEIELYLFPK